jgi:uncharacterized phiE125 gp8 family phage protein
MRAMRRFMLTPPGVEPLTLAEAKHWLRVDHTDDDGLIASLIRAAREIVEARTGRAVMAQMWRIVVDSWPADGRLPLPLTPVASISAVRLIDPAGVASVVASSAYKLEPGEEPPVFCIPSVPAPGRQRSGIEVDVVAGYGTAPEDCPAPLRQAIRLLLRQAYETRGPAGGPATPDTMRDVEALLAPYRAPRFGRNLLGSAA